MICQSPVSAAAPENLSLISESEICTLPSIRSNEKNAKHKKDQKISNIIFDVLFTTPN